jgi:hypothetical protein
MIVCGQYPGAFDCSSAYGDSALMVNESALSWALRGLNFGKTPIDSQTQANAFLQCGAQMLNPDPQAQQSSMAKLPVKYDAPKVVDVHIYPKIGTYPVVDTGTGPYQDVTTQASWYFTDLWNYTQVDRSARRIIVGETHSNQNCDKYTVSMASQSVSGYRASALYNNSLAKRRGSVILRPWNNNDSFDLNNTCYVMPSTINPPYTFP